jgi:hypothetical protein
VNNAEKKHHPVERGRVLRVKLGYNPNSSSIGSAIPRFLVFALASGMTATFLLHLRGTIGRLIRNRSRDAEDHGSKFE